MAMNPPNSNVKALQPLDFRLDRKAHRYFLGDVELPGITRILKESGLTTEFSYHPEALRRGTLVHAFCQYYDENDLDWSQVPDALMGYVIAWEKLRKHTGITPVLIEDPRYHPVLMFAGMPDREVIFPDFSRAVLEIKTGPIQPATALQTAAQEILIAANDEIRVARKRMAVQLKPDGTYSMEIFKNHRDGNMFLSALALHHWRKSNGIIPRDDNMKGE